MIALGHCFRQSRTARDDLLPCRQHTEKCRRAAVDDCLTVNENLEFSVAAPNHFYLGRKFTTQTRRHTDGVESRYSIRAIANCDPCHVRT